MVRWQAHTIAKIPNGYQVAVADVNGDGRPDILALSSVESIVEWYENPSWKARPITTATRQNISLAPLLRKGYPQRGLALATDFALSDSTYGGSLWWGEPGSSLDAEWSLRLLGRIPTSHRLRWADLDGSGRLGLVDVPLLGYGAKAPEYKGGASLTWFEPPEPLLRGHVSATDTGKGEWLPHLIDDSLTVVHGVHIMDWDNDGREEILTASFEGVHLFHLRWADLDGSGRLGLVDVPLLGYGAKAPEYKGGASLTWFEPPEPLLRGHVSATDTGKGEWLPHLIDDSLTVVHGVHIMDWDNDGREEILTASFEGVHLFHSTGTGRELQWTKTRLAAGDQVSSPRRGSSEIGVGRLDGRHFLATIEPWHGERVVVYTRGKPGDLWSRHPIDDTFRDGHALVCADLDGDGNDEIVAGFRGPGTSLYVYYAADASGLKWERQTLDTQMAASGVVVADISGDGHPDVVAIGASTANVKWYENLGGKA